MRCSLALKKSMATNIAPRSRNAAWLLADVCSEPNSLLSMPLFTIYSTLAGAWLGLNFPVPIVEPNRMLDDRRREAMAPINVFHLDMLQEERLTWQNQY